MTITLNGQLHPMNSATTVEGLLGELKLRPVRVAVEVNEELVPRKTFHEALLHDGDRVEVVTFVGGG